MEPASPPLLSRRSVLRLGGGLALAAAFTPAIAACANASDNRLLFLNWQDYVDPALLRDFEKREDVSIGYETFASNDELADRLGRASVTRRRGREATTVDLVVPSDNLLRQLRDDDALSDLDADVVTERLLDNLAPALRSFDVDPGNRFSVPWATGTTGIGYDTSVFDEPPDWDVFLDEEYQDRITLLDEEREAFAAALYSLDRDPNTTDQSDIDDAADQLIKMKAVIRGFDSAHYLDDLAEKKLVAAHAFSTDVLQARERNPDLAFVVPESGGTRWIDSLSIPDDAPNPDGANTFIAFYLDPKVSATNAAYNKVDTGNAAAREFIPEEVLEDPAAFPPRDVLDRTVFIADLGSDEDKYASAWDRVRD